MKYSILLTFLIVLVIVLETASGYRILGIFPHVGKSHHYVFEPLMKGLAEKGHEVTMITHFPTETPIKNYKNISLKGSLPNMFFSGFRVDLYEGSLGIKRIGLLVKALHEFFTSGFTTCKAMLENKEVQNIKENDFDIIIVEQFNTDCGLGLVHKLKVPFIGVTSHSIMPWTNNRLDLIVNPAYVPNNFLEHGRKPSLFGKVEGIVMTAICNVMYRFYAHNNEHKLMKEYYGADLPELEDIAKNMSLILVNTHFSLMSSTPRTPNHVEMSGIHLKMTNTMSLELKKYLDKSTNGVILFSMGSMLVSSSWPDEKLKAFNEAFAELPYDVLWKWENDTMPGISKNIKLMKWIPQFEILCHKNIKAFITHTGMLGTVEAVHCGVPMLNIPICCDQFSNAAAVKDSGIGETLNYYEIKKESVLVALKKVLGPEMKKTAMKLSAAWKDRPLPPLETAIYWIEHVARHGGQYLRSAAADLPLYQYLLLDVVGILILLACILIYVAFKAWKCFIFILKSYFITKSKKD